jgi:hypothetical protein
MMVSSGCHSEALGFTDWNRPCQQVDLKDVVKFVLEHNLETSG